MANLLQMDLTAITAARVMADIASDSARVFFTRHAEQRMTERRITRTQVLRCLRLGRITEGPYRDISGNWKMTMQVASAGNVITVVAALDWHADTGHYAIVVTSYL